MRRKISNAPAPIRPLPLGGYTELPEREAKPRAANRQDLKTPAQARKRGPKAVVSKSVEDAMTKDLQQKKITMGKLRDMPEEALVAEYGASRDTVRKVRNKILSEFVDNSNSDK